MKTPEEIAREIMQIPDNAAGEAAAWWRAAESRCIKAIREERARFDATVDDLIASYKETAEVAVKAHLALTAFKSDGRAERLVRGDYRCTNCGYETSVVIAEGRAGLMHEKDFTPLLAKEQMMLNTAIASGELHENDDNFTRGASWAFCLLSSRLEAGGKDE